MWSDRPSLLDGTSESIHRHQRRCTVFAHLRFRACQRRCGSRDPETRQGSFADPSVPADLVQLTLNSPVAPFEASLNLWVTKG